MNMMIEYNRIDEYGSCYPPELWDPDGLPPEDFAAALEKDLFEVSPDGTLVASQVSHSLHAYSASRCHVSALPLSDAKEAARGPALQRKDRLCAWRCGKERHSQQGCAWSHPCRRPDECCVCPGGSSTSKGQACDCCGNGEARPGGNEAKEGQQMGRRNKSPNEVILTQGNMKAIGRWDCQKSQPPLHPTDPVAWKGAHPENVGHVT